MRKLTSAVAGFLVCSAIPALAQGRAKHYSNSLAPYVVSPQAIVDRMLEMADLKPGETLYDLGSGDGRILLTAVQRFRAKAVGIEISDALVDSTNTGSSSSDYKTKPKSSMPTSCKWISAQPTW